MYHDYDVAIIGAGIGGLMCGNFLAQKGIKTIIFEQHHYPGGCMSSFTRGGFTFDSCDQSFESAWTVFPLLRICMQQVNGRYKVAVYLDVLWRGKRSQI